MADGNAADLDAVGLRAFDTDVALGMDEAAFRLLYERTSRPLWVYLSRVSGSRQQADDLLQETYYRFIRSGRTFESDDHQRRYLFRIATNLVLDDRRRPKLDVTTLSGQPESGSPHAAQPHASGLASAMARLKPRDRSLLWLAYAHGASHEEIAAQTGLKQGSVKQLLFRARRRLATLLRGER